MQSNWNYEYLEKELKDYEDKVVAQFCKFGWPINIENANFTVRSPPRNWRSATNYAAQMDAYVERETRLGTLLGPFDSNPFKSQAIVSTLSTTEKKGTDERRVIMDLSFPPGDSNCYQLPWSACVCMHSF